ncbi:hypothetical protein [Tautonia plasticadhaerens]|nr:hypothetical protein [Tautonia plasticadhaerens]
MKGWGSIGERYTFGSFQTAEDALISGVRCTVASGVVYLGPVPPATGMRGWQGDGQDLLHFLMPLGDDPMEPSHQSLGALARVLRERAESAARGEANLVPGDEDQRRLDWAVDRLVEIAQRMRDAGTWLGQVHLDNVLIVEPGGFGKPEIILTDWGFAFQQSLSFRPDGDAPQWVRASPWAILWDATPEEMNQIALEGGRPPDDRTDSRTLARLLACLLVGREAVESWFEPGGRHPGRGTPFAGLPEGRVRTSAGIWPVLKKALEGRSGLDELGAGIRANPPSGHFVDLVEASRREVEEERHRQRLRRRRLSMQLGVGIPLLLASAAGGFLALKASGLFDPEPPSHPLCPTCPGSSPLTGALEQFAEARGRAEEVVQAEQGDLARAVGAIAPARDGQLDALAELHRVAIADGRTPTEAERGCLAKVSRGTTDDLRRDYDRLFRRLDGLSDDPRTECELIDKLISQVEVVGQFDPELASADWVAQLKETRRWNCGDPEP